MGSQLVGEDGLDPVARRLEQGGVVDVSEVPEDKDEVTERDDRLSYAPWTDEEVKSLNDYQASGYFHPFTCPNRGDDPHRDRDGEDTGQLVADKEGFICRDCMYEQKWAWGWMADGSWRASADLNDIVFGREHNYGASPHSPVMSIWCVKCSLEGYRPDTAELCDSIADWINQLLALQAGHSEFGGAKPGNPEVVARSLVKELVLPWFDERVKVAIKTEVERGIIPPSTD